MYSRPRRRCRCGRCPGSSQDGRLAPGPARAGDLDEEVRARFTDFGYPGTLAASTDQEFLSPLKAGDLLVDIERPAAPAVHQAAPAHPYDELSVTGAASSVSDGRAELAVRAAARSGVHAVVGLTCKPNND
jgi:hypothetical protein